MPALDDKIEAVATALAKLRAHCDRGFALAIHIRLTRPTLLYQTYAEKWSEHYSVKGFMLTDPVVRWGLEQTGSVRWADLVDQDPAGVIRDAVKFGLTNGWTYSTGPAASRTIAGLTKSGVDFTEAQRDDIRQLVDHIHAVTEVVTAADIDKLRALG
jgi:LuxR family transcriptional regulator, quorum-sensing system regulator SdiA